MEGSLAKKKPNAKHSTNRNAGPAPATASPHARSEDASPTEAPVVPPTPPGPNAPPLSSIDAAPPELPSDRTTPAMPAFVDPDDPIEVVSAVEVVEEVIDASPVPAPTAPSLPIPPIPPIPQAPQPRAPESVGPPPPPLPALPPLVDPRDLAAQRPSATAPVPPAPPSSPLRDPAPPVPLAPRTPPSGVSARPVTADGLRRPASPVTGREPYVSASATGQHARATWRPVPPFTVTASGSSGARFRAEAEVGLGAYGMTWSGRDLELARPCHITLFHPALFAEPATKKSQRERVERALRYNNAHLAPVYALGEAFGTLWVATAPVVGTPLTHWRRDVGAMRLDDVYRIVGQVLDAVAAIHAQRGVHGGLSPETVRIVHEQAWLTSPWWLSTANVPAGELQPLRTAWLAPELLFGEPADSPETDIYGAGLVLGYLLACGLTEPGHSLLVQGIDVPPAVDDVYVHATARQREARFPDVASFRAALETAAGFEWRDAQKALARSPGTGLVGVEVLAAEAVSDEDASDLPAGHVAPFAMPVPPPRDIESTSEDEAIPAFGPDGEPLAETTDTDLPPLPEPHVDVTPSRRGRRVVARTLPQGAARGSGLLPVASGLEPIITASPRTLPTAGVAMAGADAVRGPWHDDAASRRLDTPPSDPLTEEILEALMAPPPELPGPPPLPAGAPGSARVDLQGIEVLPSSWAEGSSLEVLDVGPWTPPARPPADVAPPLEPELSESTIVEAIAPALLEIDVFAKPPGPAPVDPFAEPRDLPPDPWSDSPLRATHVAPTAEPPAALSAPLPPRLAAPEGPRTRPEARPASMDVELGPPARNAPDSGKGPRPATSPRLPPAPSGPLAVSVVESLSNAYETPDPLAADPREPRTIRDPSGPLAPPSPQRSSTLGSGLYVAVPQKGPKTWWLALGAVVVGAIIAFLVLRDSKPAGTGGEGIAGADASADVRDASEPTEVLAAVVPAADTVASVDTAVAAVDTAIAVDTLVATDTAVAAADTAVAVDTTVAAVDTAVALDTTPADTAVAAVDTTVADTSVAADTAVAAGDIGPSPESFVPVDPAKIKCPDGMSKLKKKIEVTLSTGAKVEDWEVVCIDRYEYPGAGAVPSTGMDQGGARAACAAKQKRLCTRSEWRRACGGTYPYGKEYDATRCNTAGADGAPKSLVAAGSKSGCMSPSGAYDMVGNAAEWTSDGFVNGGTSLKNGEDATCGSGSRRAGGAPHIGFRCCADPKN